MPIPEATTIPTLNCEHITACGGNGFKLIYLADKTCLLLCKPCYDTLVGSLVNEFMENLSKLSIIRNRSFNAGEGK